jgi:hypothetical protein
VSEHSKNPSGLNAAVEVAMQREGERHAMSVRAHGARSAALQGRKIAPRRIACGDSVNLLPPDTEWLGGAAVRSIRVAMRCE